MLSFQITFYVTSIFFYYENNEINKNFNLSHFNHLIRLEN